MNAPRSSTLRLALAVAFTATNTAHAQARGDVLPAAMTADSVAWQRVLVHIVQSLSTEIVRAASDTASQPWELRLPADEPQRPILEAQLRTILRARPATAGDSVVHTLILGRLRVETDTARVEVQMNETRRCPGSTQSTGFGWREDVLVPRHPQRRFWGAAFSRGGVHGDRVGCPGRVR